MVEFLQQKIFYQRSLIYTQSGQFKLAASLLYKALEFGSFYNMTLKLKCLRHLEYVFSKIPNFETETFLMRNISNFYRPEKRDFLILIDSTTYLLEKMANLMYLIKNFFNQKMVESDALAIYVFDEHINKVEGFKLKKEILQEEDYFENVSKELKLINFYDFFIFALFF